MTYSVYYFSSPELGSITECEGDNFTWEEACKWFQHHTTNVTAQMGWTTRVLVVDSDGYGVAEWKYGQGITWPKEEVS